jgi:hypothetical protein
MKTEQEIFEELMRECLPEPEPPKPKPKPQLVADEGLVVRDVKARVSIDDFNAINRGGEVSVDVRRDDGLIVGGPIKRGDRLLGDVSVDPRVEWQIEAQRYDAALARQQRRQLDPYNLGLYGPTDDEGND